MFIDLNLLVASMGRVPETRKVNRCQKYLEASRGTVSAGSVSAAVPRCYLDCRTSLVTVSLQSCVETGRSLVSEDSKGTRSCRMHAATQTKSCRHVVATVQAPPQTLSQTGLAPMQYILHRYGRRSPVTNHLIGAPIEGKSVLPAGRAIRQPCGSRCC